jgi:hypothetical protein
LAFQNLDEVRQAYSEDDLAFRVPGLVLGTTFDESFSDWLNVLHDAATVQESSSH